MNKYISSLQIIYYSGKAIIHGGHKATWAEFSSMGDMLSDGFAPFDIWFYY